ncbi:MAG: hypothetical protein N2440_00245 [Actinobacteria bacterium]|nr:hypothetical protein [Actinomycetota bacterium]
MNIEKNRPTANTGRFFLVIIAGLLLTLIAVSAITFAANKPSFNQGEAAVSNSRNNTLPSGCCGLGPKYGACFNRGSRFESWSKALGLSVQQFQTLLKEGKSIEEIASSKGLRLEEVVNKVLEPDRKYLQELVKNNQLTSDEAEKILTLKKERLLQRATTSGRPPYSNGRGRGLCGGGGCGRCLNGNQNNTGI